MKKLLVLTLVLGLASLASAALTVVDSGTLAVSSDVEITFYDVALQVASGDVVLDGSAVVFNPTTLGWFGPAATVADTGSMYRASADVIFSGAAASGDIFSNIAYTGAGVVNLVEYDLTGQGTVTGSIEIIPEPATMALLGLGALVLRRKK